MIQLNASKAKATYVHIQTWIYISKVRTLSTFLCCGLNSA